MPALVFDLDGTAVDTVYATSSPGSERCGSGAGSRWVAHSPAHRNEWRLVHSRRGPGEGNEVAGETLRMTDVASRVALPKQRKAEFEKVLGEVTTTGRKKRGPDPAALQPLLDLAGYYDAVSALAGKDAKLARYPNLVLGAWQATFVQGGPPLSMASASGASSLSGDVSGASTGFDPTGNVAVPGQTARQRLSQSSRCAEDCGCDRDGMCRDLNDALNSIKRGAGAQAQLSQQLDKLKKDLCDSPSSAKDVDKMQDDLKTMGYGDYALYRVKTALNDLKLRSGCGAPEFECPLTANSTMMCPHGGRVVCTPTDANRAMPNGPQLKATDVCMVVGCPFTINGQPSPCTRVQWVPSGGSLDLDCHSVGIASGANGVPQGPVITVP